ncbi:MAG: hypothetical protein HOD72_07020 [Opitutae bacterium]|nr:hypothetical protein [Opitutae bacterium]MBT4224201.1 hypothetical protein [Opitutae bacterium]MBT5692985.1 hypothetical protein [Opitutae bacterium]MBT6461623.1 hypothetical protein [Opitutae bacterium]MBT7853410.1 hypothetical protein [Opitutae bacterium]
MNVILRIVLSLPLVSLALFSIFGFIATFEPLDPDTQMTWRVIYIILFVASLVGMILLNRRRKDTPTDQETTS